MNKLTESSLRVQQRLKQESKDSIDIEVNKLKKEYEELHTNINRCLSELEKAFESWLQYEQILSTLNQWLDRVEAEIKLGVQPNIDNVDSKIQLQKYKVSCY